MSNMVLRDASTSKKRYLANMWREKEFWPKHSQPHPPPFLINPILLVVVMATINEKNKKKKILFTITNTFAVKKIFNKAEQNVLSF